MARPFTEKAASRLTRSPGRSRSAISRPSTADPLLAQQAHRHDVDPIPTLPDMLAKHAVDPEAKAFVHLHAALVRRQDLTAKCLQPQGLEGIAKDEPLGCGAEASTTQPGDSHVERPVRASVARRDVIEVDETDGRSGIRGFHPELARVRPVELLYAPNGLGLSESSNQALPSLGDDKAKEENSLSAGLDAIRTKTAVEDWVFTVDYALPLLRNHLRVQSLDGMGLGGHETAAVAAGALLHYMRATKQGGLEHVDGLRFYERSTCLELDAVSVRNLELVEPLFSGESAQTTLFYTLDACCTPMGKRLLRSTLLRPSSQLAEIEARLDAVGEATADLRKREELRRQAANPPMTWYVQPP